MLKTLCSFQAQETQRVEETNKGEAGKLGENEKPKTKPGIFMLPNLDHLPKQIISTKKQSESGH